MRVHGKSAFALFLTGALSIVSASVLAGPSGKELYDEVVKTTPVYEDPKLQEYIRQLGEQIVAKSEMAGKKFTFTLLDSPDLNAFATRDNYVYVNRGLLGYVKNEAQLVSVIAHEVGHVTRGHVTGQEGQATGAQVVSAIAAVLSGSQEVYEAGVAYANSLIRGYGRANELEADEAGAEYMAKLGYNPEEMLSMLSIMKDYENLQKQRAKAKGAAKQTYHGIFSTHPRNDARLRTVVKKADSVSRAGTRDNGEATYRQLTEGLIWGDNFQEKEQKPERYSNMKMRVRLDFPEGWKQTRNATAQSVYGEPEDQNARLSMHPVARTMQTPEEYLYNYLKVPQLRDGKEISPARLKGFSGVLPGEKGKPDQRIAAVYYKLNAFVFTGEIKDQKLFKDVDKLFVAAIDTFRPISQREIEGQKPKSIHYVKATGATTFEALARHFNLDASEAQDLRMINGYYPAGQPKPGQWIKIFRQ